MKKINNLFPTTLYVAKFFVSKNFEACERKIPDNKKNIIWYFERRYKNYEKKTFVDIDTALSAQIYSFIDKYQSQISHFYLGSGDKDYLVVVKRALEYKIPTSVIISSKISLSKDIERIVDDVNFL